MRRVRFPTCHMDLFEFQDNLNDLIANWDRYIEDFLKSIEPDLIDANTAQLDDGMNSIGFQLPPYASPEYARMKGRAIPDLKLTGDFREAFFVKSIGDVLKIDSTDDKRDKLIKKYGLDIFGLTDESLNRLIEEQIFPDFLMFLNRKLGLT